MSAELPRTDATVVGAGIAGLIAAEILVRKGLNVTVFEARDRVGGRAYSVGDGAGTVELGATWFWPDEALVREVADRLGLSTFAQHTHGDALLERHQTGAQRLVGNPVDAPADRFTHGAQAIAHRLADRLPPGTLRLDDPVSAVALTSEGLRVYARSGSVLADDVVLAVPPAAAVEQITFTPGLPTEVHAVAARTAVWMGGIVKAVAVYDDAFWRSAGLAGSAISYAGPFQEFHDHSGPNGAPAAIFAFAPAPRLAHLDMDAMNSVFRRQLVRLFGSAAAEPTATHIIDWSRERFTAPEQPSPTASTATFGASVLQQAVHGGIRWASTETATAYAGHLEGALHAGIAAAGRIPQARPEREGG